MRGKTEIIIDVDTGIDDAVALLLALQSEKLDILGVTTVHGNVDVEKTTNNTLNMLNLFGRPDIPVAKGAAKPLVRDTIFSAEYAHGENGLVGYVFERDERQALVEPTAWDFMYEKIRSSEKKVTICLLGACTNAALLLRKYPGVANKIEKFVFMGGSHASGMVTPVASINVYYDPDALQELIHSEIPFYMATMDATTKSCLLEQDFKCLERLTHPTAKILCGMISKYAEVAQITAVGRYPGMPMHDSTTIISIIHPELFHYTKYKCEVELQGEITFGMTVIYKNNLIGNTRLPDGTMTYAYVSEEEKNVYYMDGIDAGQVTGLILDAISKIG